MSGHGQHDTDAALDPGAPHEPETSSDDFPADEPHSPGWLPLLGGALFLAGIFAFVAMGSDSKTAAELGQEAASAPPSPAAAVRPDTGVPAQRPAPTIPLGTTPPMNHPQFPHAPGN